MDLTTYIQELKDSLTAAASLGDENTQRAAGGLAGALEPAAKLALLHALSDLASEVTQQLNNAAEPGAEQITVDVRLDGRDVRVGTTRSSTTSHSTSNSTSSASSTGYSAASTDSYSDDAVHRTFAEASGDLSRTTVRMFNELKSRAEKAAAEQGVSLNSFISRAVADSMKSEMPRKWKGRDGRFDDHKGGKSAPDPTASPTTISGYVQG